VGICAVAAGLVLTSLPSLADSRPGTPEIRTEDVELFYQTYDAAHGAPSAAELQRDYLDAASEGVRQFIPHRIVSAEALAKAVVERHSLYEKTRQCAAKLPDVRRRLSVALAKLAELLPDPRFPPVTILIGRGNSGGTVGTEGVLIGLETVCNADWMQENLEDRLVHLVAHEYVHVQQPIVSEDSDPTDGTHTVLQASLVEGVAEFVAELISGSTSNAHLQVWTRGRECEIADRFLRDRERTRLDNWLYNGPGTPEQPGDLGYWVGYKIAGCYYAHAQDRKAALQDLITLSDPPEILQRSGWPGERSDTGCDTTTTP